MIRFFGIGLVSIAFMLGSLIGSVYWLADEGSHVVEAQSLGTEVVKLEPVSVPIVRNGRVEGYVVARVSVAVSGEEVKLQRVNVGAYAAEAVFRAIHENVDFNFSALRPLEIGSLVERIPGIANARAGKNLIVGAMFEGLNYVPSHESRGQNLR